MLVSSGAKPYTTTSPPLHPLYLPRNVPSCFAARHFQGSCLPAHLLPSHTTQITLPTSSRCSRLTTPHLRAFVGLDNHIAHPAIVVMELSMRWTQTTTSGSRSGDVVMYRHRYRRMVQQLVRRRDRWTFSPWFLAPVISVCGGRHQQTFLPVGRFSVAGGLADAGQRCWTRFVPLQYATFVRAGTTAHRAYGRLFPRHPATLHTLIRTATCYRCTTLPVARLPPPFGAAHHGHGRPVPHGKNLHLPMARFPRLHRYYTCASRHAAHHLQKKPPQGIISNLHLMPHMRGLHAFHTTIPCVYSPPPPACATSTWNDVPVGAFTHPPPPLPACYPCALPFVACHWQHSPPPNCYMPGLLPHPTPFYSYHIFPTLFPHGHLSIACLPLAGPMGTVALPQFFTLPYQVGSVLFRHCHSVVCGMFACVVDFTPRY